MLFNKTIKIAMMSLLLSAISCKKNDDARPQILDGFHSNGVKILDQPKIDVAPSTFSINNRATVTAVETETNFVIEGLDGEFVQITGDDESIFFLVQSDEGLTGGIIYQSPANKVYSGAELEVDESREDEGDGFYTISGAITNEDDESVDVYVTVSLAHGGAGTSSFEVEGTQAFLSGGGQGLGTYAYNHILEINADYPEVLTLVLTEILGSVNDDINVETGRLIREAGYNTHLKSDSFIASGGVDLFTSGLKRTKEAGAELGVHSWCCHEGVTADMLPMDSPGHDKQLAYFKQMLGEELGPDFYFFTLQAAPFTDIYLMTDAEIAQFQVVTE